MLFLLTNLAKLTKTRFDFFPSLADFLLLVLLYTGVIHIFLKKYCEICLSTGYVVF